MEPYESPSGGFDTTNDSLNANMELQEHSNWEYDSPEENPNVHDDQWSQVPRDPQLGTNHLWWPSHAGINIVKPRKDTRTLAERSTDHKLNKTLCKYCRIFFDTWSIIVEYGESIKNGIKYLVSVHYEILGEMEISAFKDVAYGSLRDENGYIGIPDSTLVYGLLAPHSPASKLGNCSGWPKISTSPNGLAQKRKVINPVDTILSLPHYWLIECHDPEDWRRESSRMAGVYGGSSLNLMASAAQDGTVGCLFHRDPLLSHGGKVQVEFAGEILTWDYTDKGLYTRNVDRAPLSLRAWVLQERLLAPRCLHFGISDIIWECRAKCASQRFAEALPNDFCNYREHVSIDEIWTSWSQIRLHYASAALTYQRDKLVAITDIARHIHKRTGHNYYAGIWENNFHREFCWLKIPPFKPGGEGPPDLSIPSWSWASTLGSVKTPARDQQLLQPCADIIDVQLDLNGDPFGKVTGGILTLRSKFLAFCIIRLPNCLPSHGCFKISTGVHSFEGQFQWDYEHQNCFLFPLGVFDDGNKGLPQQLRGILIKSTGNKNGQYQRVGIFNIRGELDTESLQFLVNGRLGMELEEPWASATVLTEANYASVNVDEEGIKWYTITIV
ncbi:hypothetical protein G7Y89_g5502 [Cudoniella acicularis]|uniref:Heterokaryon incompatibility domain-containing protein n=1 Tax=Cudoniella acicularis TaxID=354080 RepID=A0A8H4W3R1_9HELO|nr:hypothetical protein G7Y89_g5502 [Cudoniella acicularis]